MATPKRSALELADQVEDVTDISARQAGHSLLESDEQALAQERDAKIELLMREHLVPRPVAVVMADMGYSKGTANRIVLDGMKRAQRQREAEMAAAAAARPRKTDQQPSA